MSRIIEAKLPELTFLAEGGKLFIDDDGCLIQIGTLNKDTESLFQRVLQGYMDESANAALAWAMNKLRGIDDETLG